MDYLNQYIEMEKIRNLDFHFTMEADPFLEPDETVLPPMLIQPFIENAIWHGMNGEDKKIHISVQFKKKGDHLICVIEDDGIGIAEAMKRKNERKPGHQSVSIANIRKRIELLNRKHDQHSHITIEDKSMDAGYPGTGTIVTIHLPLEIAEE
jgi:sensor histidine kinase YesM